MKGGVGRVAKMIFYCVSLSFSARKYYFNQGSILQQFFTQESLLAVSGFHNVPQQSHITLHRIVLPFSKCLGVEYEVLNPIYPCSLLV